MKRLIATPRKAISRQLRLRILARDEFTCIYCQRPYAYDIEHFIPLYWGGTYDNDNMFACCFTCNSQKGSKRFDDYVRYMKRNGFKLRPHEESGHQLEKTLDWVREMKIEASRYVLSHGALPMGDSQATRIYVMNRLYDARVLVLYEPPPTLLPAHGYGPADIVGRW